MTETEVLRMIAQQGPWALIFVVLLFWVMRQAAKREELLMAFERELSSALAQIAARLQVVCDDVGEVKDRLWNLTPTGHHRMGSIVTPHGAGSGTDARTGDKADEH